MAQAKNEGTSGDSNRDRFDPAEEEAYWRSEYPNRDYYLAEVNYDKIAPMYRYGWEFQESGSYDRLEDAEAEAQSRWEGEGGASLPWESGRSAFRDSWERAQKRRAPK